MAGRRYNARMRIGRHDIAPNVILAPMAGVTDKPFRLLCKRLGAGLAMSEMTTSDPRFWNTGKSLRRMDHAGEPDPVGVQIAGTVPETMAEAARHNVDHGAQVIDINMGCPAKKVCNLASGSALLRQEDLVRRILEAVVAACAPLGVPVTLKTRTGWDREHRNALRVARMAQDAGIAALTLHGRTRADLYMGEAEYDTIRAVKSELDIPVVANGDIDSPEKARAVLDYTGADAVMIGRAAQGQPWIFREIDHYLRTGTKLAAPSHAEMRDLLLEHLDDHYRFYGEHTGVRTARKHIGWYIEGLPGAEDFRSRMNLIDNTAGQAQAVARWFGQLAQNGGEPQRLAA